MSGSTGGECSPLHPTELGPSSNAADVSPESGRVKSILHFPVSIHSSLLIPHIPIVLQAPPPIYTTADPSGSAVNNTISTHCAYSWLLIYIFHPILPSTLSLTCYPLLFLLLILHLQTPSSTHVLGFLLL